MSESIKYPGIIVIDIALVRKNGFRNESGMTNSLKYALILVMVLGLSVTSNVFGTTPFTT